MGLATIDPHSQKVYKEMYGNPDKSGQKSGFVRISIHFFVIFLRF